MKILVLTLIMLVTLACSITTRPVEGDIIRQPDNAPEAFVPEEGMSLDENNCQDLMLDPRDGSELEMQRSAGGVADYKVPFGKYGLGENELLRIHCENGEIAGVVKK